MHNIGLLLVVVVPSVLAVMNLMWFAKIIKGLKKTLTKRQWGMLSLYLGPLSCAFCLPLFLSLSLSLSLSHSLIIRMYKWKKRPLIIRMYKWKKRSEANSSLGRSPKQLLFVIPWKSYIIFWKIWLL